MYYKYISKVYLCAIACIAAWLPMLVAAEDAADDQVRKNTVHLVKPLGSETEITIHPGGIQTWLDYFESAGEWLFYVAVGVCIIWILLGGYQIMTAGISGQDTQASAGWARIRTAITGVLLLLFSGFILRTLNSLFFK